LAAGWTRDGASAAVIPVIDLANADDDIAAQLDAAYSDIGFCSIVNHDVPQSLLRELFAASHTFHALAPSAKEALSIGPSHRGFIGLATSTIVTSTSERAVVPNQSESVIFGRPMRSDDPDIVAGLPLAGQNQFPPEQPGLERVVNRYMNDMGELCARLRRLIAMALGADPGVFDSAFDPATTYLRLLRYPRARPGASPEEYGSSPHTDYGFITILAVDDVAGLEVRDANGHWVPATPPEDGFVMNAGDLLRRWSNGRWRSTPHRVYNHPDKIRYSIPYFYDPHVTSDVTPLQHLGDPAFETINYGDYVMHRFRSNYEQHAASSTDQ